MDFDLFLQSDSWIIAGALILFCLGLSLFVIEFFLPSYGLFGFAGVTAILIGAIQIHQTGAFGEDFFISHRMLSNMIGIGLILTAWGAYLTRKLHKKQNTTGVEAMIGQEAWIMVWRGKRGRVWISGEEWAAITNVERPNFKRGDKMIIKAVEGLKLNIYPAPLSENNEEKEL